MSSKLTVTRFICQAVPGHASIEEIFNACSECRRIYSIDATAMLLSSILSEIMLNLPVAELLTLLHCHEAGSHILAIK